MCGAVAFAACMCSPASAAFPGRDGLLAVQPTSGSGFLIVNPGDGSERRACGGGGCDLFGSPKWSSPRWSPDGRALAVTSGGLVSLVYPDGSCLDCASIPGGRPAFTTNPAVVTVVSGGRLLEYGSDGILDATLVGGGVTDAVWSSREELAVVRAHQIWVGSAGSLRSLGAGASPSWSPDGSELAIVRQGRVTVIGVRHRLARRLAAGTAPSWSPDGSSIAFIAARDRVSIVPAAGGRARTVGHVRGMAVDWQPIPVGTIAGCIAPPGSSTLVSSQLAMVTSRSTPVPGTPFPASTYMGCLRSTGRERFLEAFAFQSQYNSYNVSETALGGHYAALVEFDQDIHYGAMSYTVHLFDLDTGLLEQKLGGEQVECPGSGCAAALDDLVVGSNGFTAAHTILTTYGTVAYLTERIVASDSSGVHVLDTLNSEHPFSQQGPELLTGLKLSGNTLTWNHDGTAESAELH